MTSEYPGKHTIQFNALLAEQMELYPNPISKKLVRKVMASEIVTRKVSIPLSQQKASHFL